MRDALDSIKTLRPGVRDEVTSDLVPVVAAWLEDRDQPFTTSDVLKFVEHVLKITTPTAFKPEVPKFATPEPWFDPHTENYLPNPWAAGQEDHASQAVILKVDPVLASYLKDTAKHGAPTYAQLHAWQQEHALRVEAAKFDSAENPWRADSLSLTEQSRIAKANPHLAERLKAEAAPVSPNPFSGHSANLSKQGDVLRRAPELAVLLRRAAQRAALDAQAEREAALKAAADAQFALARAEDRVKQMQSLKAAGGAA